MSLRDYGRDSRTWRPFTNLVVPLDDSNFVATMLCLACADGDHHVCYGERCECHCKGELV